MQALREVYLSTLRRFASSPGRLALGAAAALGAYGALSGAAHVWINGAPSALSPSGLAWAGDLLLPPLGWLLGLGLIRGEAASGSLALALCRPLPRGGYLLAKWAALATLLLGFLAFCHGVVLAKEGPAFYASGGLLVPAAQALQALALAAAVALFSALPTGLGELGALCLAAAGLGLLEVWGTSRGLEPLALAAGWGLRALLPGLRGDPAWSLAFNALSCAACLGAGWAVLLRREFGYSGSAA